MEHSQIRQFILSNYPLAKDLENDTHLFEKRIVDSMGVIELVSFLEKTFEVSIAFERLSIEDIKDVDSISQFIDRLKSEQGP